MTKPTHPATQTAIATLAMFFDERHEARAKFAAEAREHEPAEFPEQDAIARTWKNAADATWELVGGRPGADDGGHRTIRISLRELGKLVEMATHPLYVLHVPTATPQPSENLGAFDDGLLWRLVTTARDAWTGEGVGSFEVIVRALLSELVKAPCKLPTLNDLAKAFNTGHIPLAGLEAIESLIRARLAPHLAAQTAAIEMHKASAEHYRKAFEEKSARVAELEEAQRGDARRHAKALSDCDAATARIAELEKRLVEVPAIDGKTPGQFGYETWYPLCRQGLSMAVRDWHSGVSQRDKEIWETTCLAVLRAFGGEALRKVRERLKAISAFSCAHTEHHNAFLVKDVVQVFDNEIANLTSTNPDGAKQ